MSRPLKLALLSLDIAPGDPDANMATVSRVMEILDADTDIVALPELFSTGYTSNYDRLKALAETNGGQTIAALQLLARNYNVAICGSFLARSSQTLYNRGFFLEPNGEETFYDKRHLFSMSSESKTLCGGVTEMPVVRFRGWNVAVGVCYDLRFPVWCRNNGLRYDVLVMVANWPESRRYAWRQLLIARAIENQAYVIGVDRSGEDKFGVYDDMSCAFDYLGKPLDERKSDAMRSLSYFELDGDGLHRWREEFTPWRDADDFTVKL